jgi:hypothetical protein
MATIRFENVDPGGDSLSTIIPSPHKGLNWDNFRAFDTTESSGGYVVGTRSGTSIGFNSGGSDAGFSREEGTFSLKNGFFTAANLELVEVRVIAYLDGEKVGAKRFDAVNTDQTFVKFGSEFAHIDEVVVSTNDAVQSQVAMDDLKIAFDLLALPASGAHDQALAAHAAAHELLLQGLNSAHHATDLWMMS